jgi:aldose 1-epimerase
VKNNMIAVMLTLGVIASALLVAGCAAAASAGADVTHKPFGTADGQAVELYTLRNGKGAEASIMTYGGAVTSLIMPDNKGNFGEVVLGSDTIDMYLKGTPYFGALVGRYGNRIAKGQFTLDGKTYQLPVNDGKNSLHGGSKGFDKVVWKVAKADVGPDGPRLVLTYLSKDGDQGYPGNLQVEATYTLTTENALRLDFSATTDKATVLNLTHHSYFNLAGKGDVLNHVVQIEADKYTPVDSGLIPTGELRPVEGTPFDFRKPTPIGARINQDDEQLKFAKGYDDNWVINKPAGALRMMARVSEPTTGRVLDVWSTEPGLQFYTGNFLDGTIVGRGGWAFKYRNAFCMEPQHFPDSPNQSSFPSTELKPGQTYKNTIIYKFSVK